MKKKYQRALICEFRYDRKLFPADIFPIIGITLIFVFTGSVQADEAPRQESYADLGIGRLSPGIEEHINRKKKQHKENKESLPFGLEEKSKKEKELAEYMKQIAEFIEQQRTASNNEVEELNNKIGELQNVVQELKGDLADLERVELEREELASLEAAYKTSKAKLGENHLWKYSAYGAMTYPFRDNFEGRWGLQIMMGGAVDFVRVVRNAVNSFGLSVGFGYKRIPVSHDFVAMDGVMLEDRVKWASGVNMELLLHWRCKPLHSFGITTEAGFFFSPMKTLDPTNGRINDPLTQESFEEDKIWTYSMGGVLRLVALAVLHEYFTVKILFGCTFEQVPEFNWEYTGLWNVRSAGQERRILPSMMVGLGVEI